MSSGNKYHRVIYGLKAHGGGSVTVDVYAVLSAYVVTNPGAQHALKKMLCSGIRGKASRIQDLTEARDALDRVIEDAEREASQELKEQQCNSRPVTTGRTSSKRGSRGSTTAKRGSSRSTKPTAS